LIGKKRQKGAMMENLIWGIALFVVPVLGVAIVRHFFELEVVDDTEDLFADLDEWSDGCNAIAGNASTIPAEWDDLTI
jgi:hypothetical protein